MNPQRADRFALRDLLSEAAFGVGARPGRLVLTTLGTVLGIASLVVTIGLAQTAAGQIAHQFDEVASTHVAITPGTTENSQGGKTAIAALPWDAPARVGSLAGVERAGLYTPVPLAGRVITAVPVNDPAAPAPASPPLVAASPGLFDAIGGKVVTGRFFDDGHDARDDRVAVLGERAASALGISRLDSQPVIFIGGKPYAVIGIVGAVDRHSDVLDAVIVPDGIARAELGMLVPAELDVKIDVGAGPVVARQAPIALDPNAPETFTVVAPAAGSSLQTGVQADVNVIFLILSAIALLAGGLGIANITLLSVTERTGEIGLRRALGATRRMIGAQFMVESVVIGLLGGLVGAAVGAFAVVGVSIVEEWTPILDVTLALGSALLGGVVGVVAGAYPALKASSIEPVVALRG